MIDAADSTATTTKTWTVTEPAGAARSLSHDEFVALLAERLYGFRLDTVRAAAASAPELVAA